MSITGERSRANQAAHYNSLQEKCVTNTEFLRAWFDIGRAIAAKLPPEEKERFNGAFASHIHDFLRPFL